MPVGNALFPLEAHTLFALDLHHFPVVDDNLDSTKANPVQRLQNALSNRAGHCRIVPVSYCVLFHVIVYLFARHYTHGNLRQVLFLKLLDRQKTVSRSDFPLAACSAISDHRGLRV